ncbi:hypothetical protein Poli38472_007374 [Pythium oligandrum]|uniref:PRORP domain-containing protein n=1 Tax=Pythium oligandrum TaxID=41045 RepID=A0A8K1C9K4_PYTOL|nr:hypothetical protein Poli38472_007374 [Pythium oligandrum]|eukprot:TMW59229.1 hypothetical protein Poli38472_007374 [Pythium oligandrum]
MRAIVRQAKRLHANARVLTRSGVPPVARSTQSLSSTPALISPLEARCRRFGSSSASAPISSEATEATTRVGRKAQQWNIHHDIVTHNTPLPDVFDRLRSEVEKRGLAANRVRQAVDTFYFHCVQQLDQLSPAFVSEVLTYFSTSLFTPEKTKIVVGEVLNEAVFAAVVKLYLSRNEVESAWTLALQLSDVAGSKVHFRTVGPIIDHEARAGNFDSAISKWQHLKSLEMEWTKTMEDTLVQLIIACHRHHHANTSTEPVIPHMQEMLDDLRFAVRAITPDNVSRLRNAFQGLGYQAKTLVSDEEITPECSSCHTRLEKAIPTEQERMKLVDAIESGAVLKVKNVMTTKEFLVPFKRWILGKHAKARREGKLHYILDGPNIAYLNQNFDAGCFRFDHVDRVARTLQDQGHEVSITIPFSYLEESSKLHIRTKKLKQMRRQGKVATRMRTPEEKAMIDRWRDENLVFSCRTDFLSDDIFWLYASALLGTEARVVTNDQGRDHVFALLDNRTQGMKTTDLTDEQRISIDLLTRWRESTIVNIEIQHRDLTAQQKIEIGRNPGVPVIIPVQFVRLIHPRSFSRVPQVSDAQHFHFPIDDASKKWLCMYPSTA